MVQTAEVASGQKRGVGRPPKNATPITKKPRLSISTPLQVSSTLHSPSNDTPTKRKREIKLPTRISESKPIPTLPHPQRSSLPDDEYQSIAASAVLSAALARSQHRWTHECIFERYWTKPETGKGARPPPPNNPDLKSMKLKGECRIRIEPHIFECQMYVADIPKPPPPPKQQQQYNQPVQSAYGQPYRTQQAGYGQQNAYQGQTLAPMTQQNGQGRTLPPLNPSGPRSFSLAQSSPSATQDKKPGPDPVITKLAARASSDPELKTLMKEVATGNATQDQLKVFQKHIDELQRQIKVEKEREEAEKRAKMESIAASPPGKEDVIRYDGALDNKPKHDSPQQSTPSYQTPWRPPVPTQAPVILAFTIPGASEDRFLFPQNSILERLSPHHYLASFIVVRAGKESADPHIPNLNPKKDYWQPVTLMLEVKVGLEELPGHVQKWVRPPEEVRKGMEEIMTRCERAPEGWVAMRLPVKGLVDVEEGSASASGVSKEATPVVEQSGKAKAKSNIKYVKRASTGSAATKAGPGDTAEGKKVERKASIGKVKTEAPIEAAADARTSSDVPAIDGAADTLTTTTETGRPRRTARKSVRISEA
ncbi:hypothetical protein LTR78_004889 [Recurvomyces mirabilis]|uniref:SWR1-complex protein 3 domain-containing protein n=1 Tax=Recurvomyces mirabilis TaxID=574656 RepID=A0AAE1C2E6_9PEZI|nr:hypothetical protein LTR78_004889 [Recurvomyces mirabilis]KAK5158059.1 hypothetical protein LTS14_003982 [Recurvomyces mirabilis]